MEQFGTGKMNAFWNIPENITVLWVGFSPKWDKGTGFQSLMLNTSGLHQWLLGHNDNFLCFALPMAAHHQSFNFNLCLDLFSYINDILIFIFVSKFLIYLSVKRNTISITFGLILIYLLSFPIKCWRESHYSHIIFLSYSSVRGFWMYWVIWCLENT